MSRETLNIRDFPSFENIYMIYFYIDDYATACNFWVLCKHFTINYMKRYTKSYKYKFKILSNSLFTFLYLLPDPKSLAFPLGRDINSHRINLNYDLNFYEMISTQFISNSEKQHIINDIRFIYRIYKVSFISFFLYNLNLSALQLPYIYMSQGFSFIDSFFTINHMQNRITITPKYFDRLDIYKHFIQHTSSHKFDFIKDYQIMIDYIEYLKN